MIGLEEYITKVISSASKKGTKKIEFDIGIMPLTRKGEIIVNDESSNRIRFTVKVKK